MSFRFRPRRLALAALITAVSGFSFAAHHDDPVFRLPDHYEFDATLNVGFQPDAQGRYWAKLGFHYPAGSDATVVAWQLDLLTPSGETLFSRFEETRLKHGRGGKTLIVDSADSVQMRDLAPGFYTVRLRAVPGVPLPNETDQFARIKRSFELAPNEVVEQSYDIRVGNVPAPVMPAFAGLARGQEKSRPATASLPYTIYYGNMHSQTNHSDGGTPVGDCGGSEVPQGGAYGPADAYAMMDVQAGGDFLLASEHNHMYDGSTGTNSSASPTTANNLFASGVSAANTYNSAHPDFLGLYGNEWGVITNGGHLNLINPDALPSWEYNASSQLIGAVATPKSDYATLYSVMKTRGWIGQFNHPSSSQFAIGGTGLAYHADGAQVMVMAEIMNTSAFSTNTTETETSKSTYIGAFNTLLERGYKVAPATNQDNHCANWGLSFRNRTGVLVSNSLALNKTNFIDALKARRVFASEDKNAQLILTLNGNVMGQTLNTSGALTLTANYASASGGTVSRVQFYHGVQGRNGTVTQLYEGSGTYTFTPSNGLHFYYAVVTEADGDRLWSAPVWINQGAAPSDTTPPTVSASESGSSGTITLSATASDNVGVTNVEFYIDGVLRGSDASSPYSMTFNSTALSNGSHSLTAKAFDAAGLNTTSAPVSFSINNLASPVERITNGGYESGSTGWTMSSGVLSSSSSKYPAHSGTRKAWLNGYGSTHTDYVWQSVSIPAAATTATLKFWLRVDSSETTTTTAYDTLKIQIRNSSNAVLATLATYSNLNESTSYSQKTFDVSAYKGQTIRVYFEGIEGSMVQTSFLVDDVSLVTQ